MSSRKTSTLGALLAALLFWGGPVGAAVHEGEVIPETKLPALGGGAPEALFGPNVTVFVFFRPGQEHSRSTLVMLAGCQKDLADKPVRWVGLVSDQFPAAEVKAEVKETGFAGPILVDSEDALYGSLGIALHPTIGIADKGRKVLAYMPFAKVNYCDSIMARVRFALGEITEEQLQAVLNPAANRSSGEGSVARRFLKMAGRLYQAKNYDKALEPAKKAVENGPDLAAAHGLLAAILAAKGDCKGAAESSAKAFALDPKDASALEANAACAGK